MKRPARSAAARFITQTRCVSPYSWLVRHMCARPIRGSWSGSRSWHMTQQKPVAPAVPRPRCPVVGADALAAGGFVVIPVTPDLGPLSENSPTAAASLVTPPKGGGDGPPTLGGGTKGEGGATGRPGVLPGIIGRSWLVCSLLALGPACESGAAPSSPLWIRLPWTVEVLLFVSPDSGAPMARRRTPWTWSHTLFKMSLWDSVPEARKTLRAGRLLFLR